MAATPKTFTDGSSDLDEANLNLFVRGGKLQVKVNYFELLFTASTNAVTVNSGVDSDGEVISADLSWNAGGTRLEVIISGFSAPPVVQATISSNASTNVEKVWVNPISSTLFYILFKSNATPGTTVDPDGNVELMVTVIGA